MRSRSNSGVRLDGYARLVQQTILCYQVRRDHVELPSRGTYSPTQFRLLALDFAVMMFFVFFFKSSFASQWLLLPPIPTSSTSRVRGPKGFGNTLHGIL